MHMYMYLSAFSVRDSTRGKPRGTRPVKVTGGLFATI